MSVEFVARVRGKNRSPYYEDLMGNSYGTSGTIQTATGRFGGSGVRVPDTTQYTDIFSKNPIVNTSLPFTLSTQCKTTSTSLDASGVVGLLDVTSSSVLQLTHTISVVTEDSKPVLVRYHNFISDFGWHHWALTYDGSRIYVFCDGILLDAYNYSIQPLAMKFSPVTKYNTTDRVDAVYDDMCVINECLWTRDFIPPADYFEIPKKIILSVNDAYGVGNNNSFVKLADDFNLLNDSDKLSVFNNVTSTKLPDVRDLSTLTMPINMIIAKGDSTTSTCLIKANPTPQLLTQTTMLDIPQNVNIKLVGIDGVVTGEGNIKVGITKNGTDYYVYNFFKSKWELITDVSAEGMDYNKVELISTSAWHDFGCTQLGFKIYLDTQSVSDVVKLDNIVVNYA